MNHKFDELAKGVARSISQREALGRFGGGILGAVLATLGVANKAEAKGASTCCTYDVYCYETGKVRVNFCAPAGESCPSSYTPCLGYSTLMHAKPVRDYSNCK